MKYYLMATSFSLLCACNPSKQKIRTQINSGDPTEIIKACNLLEKKEDTIFIKDLLRNPYDTRISHNLKYKGISVYQAKVKAFKRISGLNPPNEITYNLDSFNIEFYVNWVKSKGFYQSPGSCN